jgi:hypothetical protein
MLHHKLRHNVVEQTRNLLWILPSWYSQYTGCESSLPSKRFERINVLRHPFLEIPCQWCYWEHIFPYLQLPS